MTRFSRWAIALVTTGLAAGAAYWFVYLPREHEEPVPELVDAAAGDAATDARAPVGKAKPGKKAAPRGGKTRVTGKATAGKPPVPHGTKAPPVRPHEKHEKHEKLPSYESALDGNDEQVAIGAKGEADLSDAQLSAPMSDGTFLAECGAPDSMSVTVKVAIRGGHAVGVSVETSPPSAHVNGCIERHVHSLAWPVSPKMDSLVTSY